MKAFSSLSARSRRYRRGAVFVEAVIIITSLVLFLMGMMFFRRVYYNKLFVMRAARGATLAYAMGGCKVNDPKAWLDKDKPPAGTNDRAEDKNSQPTSASPPNDDKAKSIYNSLPQVGADGNFLNPINKVTVSTPVSVLSNNKGFKGDSGSISFVTCDDVVRNGDFGEMVDKVTSAF